MRALLIGLLIPLGGCSYISAAGSDSSTLKVERRCDVEISHAAHVAGREESNVTEDVFIDDNCQVTVKFRQNVEEQ